MADYLITRVRKGAPTSAGHEHIIAVEIDDQERTVEEIYALIMGGNDVFYTRSPSSGKEPMVHAWRCCLMSTLRSDMKAERDSNLNYLPTF